MKPAYTLITSVIILFFLNSIFAQDPDTTRPTIKIVPEEVDLFVGDSLLFQAVYIDTNDVERDTSVTWAVTPDSLGSMLQSGWFAAEKPGEGFISALLDTLTDTVAVKIEVVKKDTISFEHHNLVILPRDTLITVGSQVQFQALYQDTTGALVDTSVIWSLDGMPVAEIDTTGLLTANQVGFALVRAVLEDREGTSFVVIVDSTLDTTGVDTITITRTPHSPMHSEPVEIAEITEGGLWKISGLQHPLNILNASVVYFPPGCLTENIRIHVEIPTFANHEGDTVMYQPHGVVGGIEFQVLVDSVHTEPYEFEYPLVVGMIFKRGLLRHHNIDPSTLGLYFAAVEGDSVVFDPEGISYTTVDSCANRIYSSVAHFSSLAIKGEVDSEILSAESGGKALPTGYYLEQNFPNPFNPVTTLRYSLPEAAQVQLIVYDLLGREIMRLVDQQQRAGAWQVTWNGRDGLGQLVSAGIYLYRMTAGDFVQTRKMVLLK
ncbi:T9SS type A sorting domain-containing protein [Candidatus Neomarinimicrobiota bacterium]